MAPPCQDRAGTSPHQASGFPECVPEPAPPEAPAATVGSLPSAPAAPAGQPEPKGCIYALSQPPLMLFLCVIGGLIGAGAAWDLLFV